jgi:hypothetical protein
VVGEVFWLLVREFMWVWVSVSRFLWVWERIWGCVAVVLLLYCVGLEIGKILGVDVGRPPHIKLR